MNLTLKDRMLILNTVLPQFDTRANMTLKIAISGKIAISDTDQKRIMSKDLGNGQIEIGFKDAEAITETNQYDFSLEEIMYLKSRIDFIDHNGMFSEFTIETYNKICSEVVPEEVAES